ncbi:MAG: hypothetical protein J6S40_04200 [Thermoguttaceae bacterium]|nr:hypothetical protein [Thermoguttaceae bacterium]
MIKANTPSSVSGVSFNPFSVGYVQPGSIPYFFEPTFIEEIRRSASSLYVQAFAEAFQKKMELSTWIGCRYLDEKFAAGRYRAQVVGPHGSGKSTMTESFAKYLNLTGIGVVKSAIHSGTHTLPDELRAELDRRPADDAVKCVVIFDGYEQLGALSRLRLRRLCRSKNLGLLVTTHKRQWFVGPVLYRTATSDETLEKIVSYLLDDSQRCPGKTILRELRRRHKNNVRAILDGLYDWWNGARRGTV